MKQCAEFCGRYQQRTLPRFTACPNLTWASEVGCSSLTRARSSLHPLLRSTPSLMPDMHLAVSAVTYCFSPKCRLHGAIYRRTRLTPTGTSLRLCETIFEWRMRRLTGRTEFYRTFVTLWPMMWCCLWQMMKWAMIGGLLDPCSMCGELWLVDSSTHFLAAVTLFGVCIRISLIVLQYLYIFVLSVPVSCVTCFCTLACFISSYFDMILSFLIKTK